MVDDPAAYPVGTAPDCAYAQTVLPDGIDPVDASMIITLSLIHICRDGFYPLQCDEFLYAGYKIPDHDNDAFTGGWSVVSFGLY